MKDIKYYVYKGGAEDLTTTFAEIRNAVGWKALTDRQIINAVENSFIIVVAKHENNNIGMGRVLYDDAFLAYISDIAVIPQFQHRGIGTKIVRELIRYVCSTADMGEEIMFTLDAGKDKEIFYEKIGFIKRPNNRSGCGMNLFITV